MAKSTAGKGAQFLVYVSPTHDTATKVPNWRVVFEQGNWTGEITSANPKERLQTPGLSGTFQVTATGSGPHMPKHRLPVYPGDLPDVGCNSNSFAIVGILASQDGTSACYTTTYGTPASGKPSKPRKPR